MADQRSYTGGRFAIDIDGFNVGFVKKFSGLAMEADIAENDLGPDNFQAKHVANIKWTPGKATFGIGMGKALYDWMKLAFDKAYVYKSGTIRAADFDSKCMQQLTFQQALMTSITVPTLDGSSKEAAYFDVEFQPEQVRWEKGDGKKIEGKYGTKQKAWLCSNFKFELGSLPCHRVNKIDTFTWKCAVTADQIGSTREPTYHPAKVTVPDIKVTISAADRDAWQQAAKKWFVDGDHLASDEMQGRIVLMSPNMKDEIGEIELKNVGFKKFALQDLEANKEVIDRFEVTLYVEGMSFKINTYDA